MNQEIFDLVHPDDADKIRDQLSATESPDAGRVLDLKSKSYCTTSTSSSTTVLLLLVCCLFVFKYVFLLF